MYIQIIFQSNPNIDMHFLSLKKIIFHKINSNIFAFYLWFKETSSSLNDHINALHCGSILFQTVSVTLHIIQKREPDDCGSFLLNDHWPLPSIISFLMKRYWKLLFTRPIRLQQQIQYTQMVHVNTITIRLQQQIQYTQMVHVNTITIRLQ